MRLIDLKIRRNRFYLESIFLQDVDRKFENIEKELTLIDQLTTNTK